MMLLNMRIWTLVALGLILFSPLAHSQSTIVFGRVTEAQTGAPVSFATVYFKGINIGTVADELGNFVLETKDGPMNVTISSIGFWDTTIAISPFTKQEIRVNLKVKEHMLNELVIRAGENPAYEIIRKAIKHKEKNSTRSYNTYSYGSYNKVEFDLNNYSEKIKKSLLFKPFPMIWGYQDTLVNGQKFLPFLFKENVRKHYYRKSPENYKEYVIGDRKEQFFRGPKIEKFIEELYLNPDVYDNFIVILNKSFPSPLHDDYKRFYRFLLVDTMKVIDGSNCHHIRFYPQGANDVAFVGEMYIEDQGFAVKQLDLNFSIEANINFVRSFWIRSNYLRNDAGVWFPSEITVLADFTVVENSPELTGFFGKRFSKYRDFVVNTALEDSLFLPIERTIELAGANEKDSVFFNQERGVELSLQEKRIAEMVDTIKAHPRFRLYKGLFNAIGTGWVGKGDIEFGNLASLISYNDVEGLRLKAGFRTSKRSDNRIRPSLYLAYGTQDKSLKYAGDLGVIVNKSKSGNKYNLVGVGAQKDVYQIGLSPFTIPVDHFLSYFIQVAPFDTRSLLRNKSAYIERQWFVGLVSRLEVFSQEVSPFDGTGFSRILPEGEVKNDVGFFSLGGIRMGFRFAYGEQNIRAKYNDAQARFFMLRYPAVAFEYTYSQKGRFYSDFEYSRLNLRIEQQVRMNRWGYLSYLVEGTKVFGNVPYVFLSIPNGNQSVLADRASFNMMNYLEFASDQSLAFHIEHHFDGLFLNRIPWIRKWKLREFLLARVFMGSLSDENNQKHWTFPERLNPIGKPYYEVGFGLENILKISRIDFTWRLNYLQNPNTYDFLPKPSFYFKF